MPVSIALLLRIARFCSCSCSCIVLYCTDRTPFTFMASTDWVPSDPRPKAINVIRNESGCCAASIPLSLYPAIRLCLDKLPSLILDIQIPISLNCNGCCFSLFQETMLALGLCETLPDGKHAVDNDGVDALLDLALEKRRSVRQPPLNPGGRERHT